MYDLNYVKPKSSSDALNEYQKASEGQFLAGGMTLIPTLKSRLSSSDLLIDLADTFDAGIIRSPSFSLLSSSTKTKIFPFFASFKISLIFENLIIFF